MNCKRYCKGCWDDVTDTMWCWCGESPLSKSSTYSEEEMAAMDGPPDEPEEPFAPLSDKEIEEMAQRDAKAMKL